MTISSSHRVAIIGSGPAGLMAASVLSKNNIQVSVFDMARGPGPRLLVAGKSGLNISNEDLKAPFNKYYSGPESMWQSIFSEFDQNLWLSFIQGLGLKTFKGTSRRFFIEGLKAAPLLKAWMAELKDKGVEFFFDHTLKDFESSHSEVRLTWSSNESQAFDAVIICTGGASWGTQVDANSVAQIFRDKSIHVNTYTASNVGYHVDWLPGFVDEAEGKPLKNVKLKSCDGDHSGELIVTQYGLEGTLVYALKEPQDIHLDLKPDLTKSEILERLSSNSKSLSPIRLIKKKLNLCEASQALLYHYGAHESKLDLEELVDLLKSFPITLTQKRGLSEAISSAGGVCWNELDESLMLKKAEGVYLAGELIDWDAPTGGYLIQACVSMGFFAGTACASQIESA